MRIQSFEDVIAWQKAEDLTIAVYKATKDIRDYGYKDQIQRASVSIMNNIAEGFERQSNKELIHYLYISKGSCGEVRSMVLLGRKLGIINEKDSKFFISQTIEISKLLGGFIKSL